VVLRWRLLLQLQFLSLDEETRELLNTTRRREGMSENSTYLGIIFNKQILFLLKQAKEQAE